ncbi:putative carboxypeptidase [Aspergillus steynii IBT 23096]|uniref:Putative carboxypeptidase n=1 Tax=Aspergillus steynii IBT 23096 TaxID=1392250 RepID=A0A2I2G254_9EURO|nr:putative carboxypeptidase [Aspergillus steynii IBT 23096]PLB46954.1 putative carboxypeptidase [Aspergillus steynii IBT 23096]
MLFPSSLLLATAALAAASPSPNFPQTPLQFFSSSPSTADSLDEVINDSPFLSFHRDLVQIESISGNENRIGYFVADFLGAHNFSVVKQPVTGGDGQVRFNIFAHRTSSHPQVLLTSHIDTVPPFIPYSLDRIDSDSSSTATVRISGRGTVDAKGSVAAQVFAALEVLDEDPEAPLGLLFVVDEEVGGKGMRVFSESSLNPSPSAFHTVIFGEPTDLALVAGHKGMLGFELVATGHAAHSGYPWLGQSAISAILPALSRVDRLGDIPAAKGGLPASPKYGRTTVNIGRVEAGVAANVVPASGRADVAVRLAAGTPDEAREIVRRAVRDATDGSEAVYADFSTRSEGYPPQDLDTDVAGFEVTTVNYGTDVPNLQIHDRADGSRVRRYLYGPGSIHVAHGDNEAITVAELEEAVRGYRKLIEAALDRSE